MSCEGTGNTGGSCRNIRIIIVFLLYLLRIFISGLAFIILFYMDFIGTFNHILSIIIQSYIGSSGWEDNKWVKLILKIWSFFGINNILLIHIGWLLVTSLGIPWFIVSPFYMSQEASACASHPITLWYWSIKVKSWYIWLDRDREGVILLTWHNKKTNKNQ